MPATTTLSSKTSSTKLANQNQNDEVSFYDFNDTIINKVDDSYARKFLGNSEDSAYMLIYRKKNQPLPVLKTDELKSDKVIQRVMEDNKEINELRKNYSTLKQKIRIGLVTFSDLVGRKVIAEEDYLRTTKGIPEESITELVVDKTNVAQAMADIENLLGKQLTDFRSFEIQVKHNNLIFFKNEINWDQVISQSPEESQLRHGGLILLVENDSSPKVTEFFNALQPGSVV
jgi:hypothetical protein